MAESGDGNYASYVEPQQHEDEQAPAEDVGEEEYEEGDCPPPEVPNADDLDNPNPPTSSRSNGGGGATTVITPNLKIVIALPEAPPTPVSYSDDGAGAKSGVEQRLETMAWDYNLHLKDMSSDCNGVQRIYAKMLQSKTWW